MQATYHNIVLLLTVAVYNSSHIWEELGSTVKHVLATYHNIMLLLAAADYITLFICLCAVMSECNDNLFSSHIWEELGSTY